MRPHPMRVRAARLRAATRAVTDESDTTNAADPEKSDSDADSAIQEAAGRLIEATQEDLFKWAGKTPLLEASVQFESLADAVINDSPQLTIEFPGPDIRVVLMTDRPANTLRRMLDQFKTTAPQE